MNYYRLETKHCYSQHDMGEYQGKHQYHMGVKSTPAATVVRLKLVHRMIERTDERTLLGQINHTHAAEAEG